MRRYEIIFGLILFAFGIFGGVVLGSETHWHWQTDGLPDGNGRGALTVDSVTTTVINPWTGTMPPSEIVVLTPSINTLAYHGTTLGGVYPNAHCHPPHDNAQVGASELLPPGFVTTIPAVCTPGTCGGIFLTPGSK